MFAIIQVPQDINFQSAKIRQNVDIKRADNSNIHFMEKMGAPEIFFR